MTTPHNRLAATVAHLCDGWTTRAEHLQRITVHTKACLDYQRLLEHGDEDRDIPPEPGALKHHLCHCPRRMEVRASTTRQPALIAQLHTRTRQPSAAEPGTTRTRPTSRPPAPLDAADLLTRLTDDAHTWRVRLDAPTPLPLVEALRSLVTLTAGDPETAEEIHHQLRRHARRARTILDYDTRRRTLRDVACGDCGGALTVADDASTDVRCTGTPEQPGCGNVYRRHEWIDLLGQDTG